MKNKPALSGWGRTRMVSTMPTRLASSGQASALLANASPDVPPAIARGYGRGYGDCALSETAILDMTGLRDVVSFDPETGLLTAQAGLRLSDLIELVLPLGWFPPVVPGTASVSLGGMVAADVHGKNHHHAGSIAGWVRALTLIAADGTLLRCQPGETLFAATCGGMGLTGLIVDVTLQLIRVPGAMIAQETLRARDLDHAMELFEASEEWPYSAAWIDCLAGGTAAGRCILYRGHHAPGPASPPARRPSIPFDAPGGLLNRWSLRAFNAAYYHAARPGLRPTKLAPFFFPLDAIGGWNRLYGRRGFHQHQSVLPLAASRSGLREMLAAVRAAGLGSFLAVLKLFGVPLPESGPLSFPMRGYTLALDFPNTAPALALMERLDRIVLDHGGRLYLAKDSRQKPELLRHYDLEAFRAVRDLVDPGRHWSSLLSERLGLLG